MALELQSPQRESRLIDGCGLPYMTLDMLFNCPQSPLQSPIPHTSRKLLGGFDEVMHIECRVASMGLKCVVIPAR